MSIHRGYSEDTYRGVFRWTSDDAPNLTKMAVYFDMDGTIADLYGIDGWLDKLIAKDPSPYYDAEPLVDPNVLWDFASYAAAEGCRIGIVSWLSKECPADYAYDIINAKLAWADELLPEIDEIVIAPYGTPKSTIVEIQQNAILIDDEEQNRVEWMSGEHSENRMALSAENLMDKLEWIDKLFEDEYYYDYQRPTRYR